MKFGKLLVRTMEGKLKGEYINYKLLKQMIKQLLDPCSTEGATINSFGSQLMEEAKKVNLCYFRLISSCEEAYQDLCNQLLKSHQTSANNQGEKHLWEALTIALSHDEGSSIVNCVNELCESIDGVRSFVNLNYVGFQKILKKITKRFGEDVSDDMWKLIRIEEFAQNARFPRLVISIQCMLVIVHAHRNQSSIASKVQEELSCAICLEQTHKPVTLSCAHTYCFKCVDKCRAFTTSCPTCRRESVIHDNHSVDASLAAFFDLYAPCDRVEGDEDNEVDVSMESVSQTEEEVEARKQLLRVQEEETVSKKPTKQQGQQKMNRMYHSVLQNFRDLLKYNQKGNYVILDIDETILVHGSYPCMLMTSRGLTQIQHELNAPKFSRSQRDSVVRIVQDALRVRILIEKDTADVIKQLQDEGVYVFGLTSRNSVNAETTKRELESLGVDLTRHCPFPSSHVLTDPETQAVCRDGVIFTNGHRKGVALNRFLEGFIFQELYHEAFHNNGNIRNLKEKVPGKIVFVDDRLPNLDSVAVELRVSRHFHIPVTTYHYRRASYKYDEEEYFTEDGQPDKCTDMPKFDNAVLKHQMNRLFSDEIIMKDEEVIAVMGSKNKGNLISWFPRFGLV